MLWFLRRLSCRLFGHAWDAGEIDPLEGVRKIDGVNCWIRVTRCRCCHRIWVDERPILPKHLIQMKRRMEEG